VLTAPNDDVQSTGFRAPSTGKDISAVYVPGGMADLLVVFTAVVGGAHSPRFFDYLDKIEGVVDGGGGLSFLPTLAAPIAIVRQVEGLLKSGLAINDSASRQQFWLNDTNIAPIQVAGTPDSMATALPLGHYFVFAVQTGPSGETAQKFEDAAKQLAGRARVVPTGELVAMDQAGSNVFANFFYVTLEVTVALKAPA
jgi:hypothetical protein